MLSATLSAKRLALPLMLLLALLLAFSATFDVVVGDTCGSLLLTRDTVTRGYGAFCVVASFDVASAVMRGFTRVRDVAPFDLA